MIELDHDITRLLHDKAITIASFDFFDTLVFRTAQNPQAVFPRVAHALIEAGLLSRSMHPERFREIRIAAEHQARIKKHARTGTHEINLRDIYEVFPEKYLTAREITPRDLAQIEEKVELSAIKPFLPFVELALKAKSLKKTLIYVSDTYFSRDFFDALIGRRDIPSPDRLFLSHESGRGKGDGLWPIVISSLKANPSQMLHIGDNYTADVEQPAGHGVRSIHAPHGTSEFFSTVADENAILRPQSLQFAPSPLVSLRAKHSLLGLNAERTPHLYYGYTVLGPIFHGFIEFAIDTFSETKCAAVLPLAREGVFLRKLTGMRKELPFALLEPLYISRRHVRLVGLSKLTKERLVMAFDAPSTPSVANLLSLLGLPPDALDDSDIVVTDRIQTREIAERVAEAILSRPSCVASLMLSATQASQGLRKHFEKVISGIRVAGKGEAPTRIGILDIGWSGSIQAGLQEFLDDCGLPIHLVGSYLMTTDRTNAGYLGGTEAYGFLLDGHQPKDSAEWILRTLEVLEQSATPTDIGSLAHYDSAGQPLFHPMNTSEIQRMQIGRLQEGIVQFNDMALDHNHQRQMADAERCLLLATLERAFVFPTRSEIEMFRDWTHDENLLTQSRDPLIDDRFGEIISYMTPRQLVHTPLSEIYWPFGVASAASPFLLGQTKALRRGAAQPEDLETILGSVRISQEKGSDHSQPMLINSLGRGLIQAEVDVPIDSLVLTFTARESCVLDISGVWVSGNAPRTGRPVRASISNADLVNWLHVPINVALEGTHFLVSGSTSVSMTLPTLGARGDFAGRVRIRIAYRVSPASSALVYRILQKQSIIPTDLVCQKTLRKTQMEGWIDAIDEVPCHDASNEVNFQVTPTNGEFRVFGWCKPRASLGHARHFLRVRTKEAAFDVLIPAHAIRGSHDVDRIASEPTMGREAWISVDQLNKSGPYWMSWITLQAHHLEEAPFTCPVEVMGDSGSETG